MKKVVFFGFVSSCLLALVSPAAYASINLVSNGSFEAGSQTAPGSGAGNCSVPGWTCSVPAGNAGGSGNNVGLWTVAYGNPGVFFGGNFAPDNAASLSPDAVGNNAVYLVDDGINGVPISESITQNINVTAGQQYNVGFDVFFVQNSTGNPNASVVSLSIDGGAALASVQSNSLVPGVWYNESALFTATSTGPVSFTLDYAGGTYTGQDFLVDRAYALAATPEPGLYGVLALGLAGVVTAVRRRRNA